MATRYATALFDLAAERNQLDAVGKDLEQLGAAVAGNAELARLLSSPIVSREEHGRATTALAERLGLSELTGHFLGVLARQRRLFALPAIIHEYQRMLAVHRGEETAEVVSAVPLSEDQLAQVRESVAAHVGKPVSLETSVDPSLLGGLVVRVGSRMIDASLKTKLHNLELSMRGIR